MQQVVETSKLLWLVSWCQAFHVYCVGVIVHHNVLFCISVSTVNRFLTEMKNILLIDSTQPSLWSKVT